MGVIYNKATQTGFGWRFVFVINLSSHEKATSYCTVRLTADGSFQLISWSALTCVVNVRLQDLQSNKVNTIAKAEIVRTVTAYGVGG